jgi:hypothetical protein
MGGTTSSRALSSQLAQKFGVPGSRRGRAMLSYVVSEMLAGRGDTLVRISWVLSHLVV